MRSHPTLNQTGELKAAYWRTRMWTSSSWKVAPSSGVRKYPWARPQSRMVSATRHTSWRTPVSRSEVPSLPWRYLLATMLVAVMDQSLGTSTSFCSKMTLPCASVIWAVRRSHSTSSYGETPGLVKKRRKDRPGAFFLDVDWAGVVEAAADWLTVLSSGITGSPN